MGECVAGLEVGEFGEYVVGTELDERRGVFRAKVLRIDCTPLDVCCGVGSLYELEECVEEVDCEVEVLMGLVKSFVRGLRGMGKKVRGFEVRLAEDHNEVAVYFR